MTLLETGTRHYEIHSDFKHSQVFLKNVQVFGREK